MPTSRSSFRQPALALSLAVALAGGCRSYGPSPLALDAHEATFIAREASASEVTEFARSLAPAGAGASAFDPSDGLAVREAEIVALVFNPDLRERRLAAGIAAAGAAHAADWDDPRVGLDLTRILDGGDWEAIGSLSLTIPISGRLEIEKARADAEHLVALEELARDEWLVRAEVRRRFALVAAAAARVAAGEVHLARIEEIDALVRTLEA
ncbi:MAG: TolC family protein, partial [Planctomycetota bacterium]